MKYGRIAAVVALAALTACTPQPGPAEDCRAKVVAAAETLRADVADAIAAGYTPDPARVEAIASKIEAASKRCES